MAEKIVLSKDVEVLNDRYRAILKERLALLWNTSKSCKQRARNDVVHAVQFGRSGETR